MQCSLQSEFQRYKIWNYLAITNRKIFTAVKQKRIHMQCASPEQVVFKVFFFFFFNTKALINFG